MIMYVCNDCPRACGADRSISRGYCGCGVNARAAKTVPRFLFEEPCLGELSAVFFSGCSLRCSYCQNVKISRAPCGEEYSDEALAALFDRLPGALDLVTPTHCLGAIERALPLCKTAHSVIYNTSGYETEESVRRASEFTDVFLTDLKYRDCKLSARFSGAPDYFEAASRALVRMRERKDEWAERDGGRVLVRGLVVRHLVLPGCAKDSMAVLDFIADSLGTDTVLSLMSQFTPNGVGEPSVPLKRIEYKLVAEHALKLGFKNGYFQDFESADGRFTPDF